MEDILEKLGLPSLVSKFRRERIVPSTILSMTDDDIRILGIEAIGDLVRLRVMCREYEYEEGNAAGHGSSNSGPSVVVSKTKHSKTKTEARSTLKSKTKHLNSKTKHPELENEAP
ncbi:hypothetical protein OS493_022516 [Desmophyllum pertusum]|uniref:SAM domain-containing protein n=1 Tax=Desmophyllum pertusum TaxID=174260 RepID=A0A9W9ZBI5_9CNID|nr:hypothetical protein OS493_022516 [Desmophyllum pertusum]